MLNGNDEKCQHTSIYLFIMKNTISKLSVLALGLSSGVWFAPTVHAEEITCQGSLGAITVDNVKVPQGKTCVLNGTNVQGTIVVNSNATLRASAVRVNGNIQAEGASYVEVAANSKVGGSIQVKQGKRVRINGSQITGSIQLESNSGALVATSNVIGADLQAFQNTGGVTLRANRITGNLQCKANAPAPTGGANVVQGNKEDQCLAL
jgi:hypothetical protein